MADYIRVEFNLDDQEVKTIIVMQTLCVVCTLQCCVVSNEIYMLQCLMQTSFFM